MQGKQAKIVSLTQERAILGYLATTRYPARDQVMFLLSMKAGLRAKEMASLTWAMVTDAAGQVAEVLHVPNRASKGKTGGRTIPLHPDLQAALVTLQSERADMATPERPLLLSARGGGLSPATIRLWCHRLSTSLKMAGCSSHAGRRTFMTRAARRVSQVGGSRRDVQELAGYTSLAMTQRDIEGDTEAKRQLVALLYDGGCMAHRVSGVQHPRRVTVRTIPACLSRARSRHASRSSSALCGRRGVRAWHAGDCATHLGNTQIPDSTELRGSAHPRWSITT
jgi:integrase/recombinase XerD